MAPLAVSLWSTFGGRRGAYGGLSTMLTCMEVVRVVSLAAYDAYFYRIE